MKNNNEPLVSVIIHSFDRFQYLLNAIRSIENQTYKNYELILINDDSNEKEYYEYNFPEFVKKIDIKNYDAYQKRIFGFLGERLLNIWIIQHQKSIKIRELDIVNLEKKLVDHILDSLSLLKRKYF